ncbi:MAG: hypothetical protein L6V95_07505 [Candidatus Melainabacteria bacterium]|nr:MAG: hypothetical protein L6V95_07505 [Candidatus Melainabacteria bacterium]
MNIPAKITITPCPRANKRSIIAACQIFLLKLAVAIIAAKIGVEHGDAAKAKTIPNTNGNNNPHLLVFDGSCFTIVG